MRAISPDCRGIMQMSTSVLVLEGSLHSQRGTNMLRPYGRMKGGLEVAISLYRLNREPRQLVQVCMCAPEGR